ncbi:hypothetical protein ONS95_007374 [Cadophora gregata]|uniref:uncharacterized protein n=1 Tax=Cadophora gregata TaxID=51156 RepID=UPI0026DAE4C9|nr:uncharacterized protein ONS95_007373 [Cadophora gregata]XP_058353371.1 uncharacterized protein ONS95_004085 [Cadophora gregata]XP_058362195.1 uncharacterized protein ONS95_007374 [Cadophora gregata]KAK0100931.1 hypothetical protein ONS95_007373 [Cadophora gregata]KAK0107392.1 hypothetical protein ONS95_004085 [Cadophora gregata]KAK0125740.1 hypothetical protein ONS95_007374 [Cadophora gregata]
MFLDTVVTFPDGSRYERLEPITNFRKDDDTARILYRCRRRADGLLQSEGCDDIYVMKVKFQVPSVEFKEAVEGPNPETLAELHALEAFATRKQGSVPHLVAWKETTQGTGGLFPGGYLVITVMTLMPGKTLLELGFWSLKSDEQDTIRNAFLTTLNDIWRCGFVPYDRALRNILWEKETKQCSIVDFEHYHVRIDPICMDEKDEMAQWGILQRPALNWYQEWARSAPKKPR